MESGYNKFIGDFLAQSDATFYHITTLEKWNLIKEEGLKSEAGQIFVSRSSELPVLLFIALNQIPEIDDTEGIVVIKLPQSKCGFKLSEVKPDLQAPDHWTQPFQNVIKRKEIPVVMFELMMILDYSNNNRAALSNVYNTISESGEANYVSHAILQPAKKIYDKLNIQHNKDIYGEFYEDFLGT